MMNKTDLLRRVGSMNQIAGFQKLMITEGKGKGNALIHVRNGSGLQFHISVDRAFDIGFCEFLGVPLSWLSPTGPVAPSYYDKEEREWNRSFEGGLLTTCGLTYMGKPSIDQGVSLGLHGRISSTPARVLMTEAFWEEDDYCLVFKGEVRESSALSENVRMERLIRTRLGVNEIEITDRVTNEAFQPMEHMILYHFNFGYPLINETTRVRLPDARRRWISGTGSAEGWESFEKPQDEFAPTVMLHELEDTSADNEIVCIENRIVHNGAMKHLKIALSFDPKALPFVTQWKHAGAGRYVMGIEPGNATTEGREMHRKLGTLPFLMPGETKEYRLKLSVELEEGGTAS